MDRAFHLIDVTGGNRMRYRREQNRGTPWLGDPTGSDGGTRWVSVSYIRKGAPYGLKKDMMRMI